jgi:hypothetical protein
MKKIIPLILISILVAALLVACSAPEPFGAAWANSEKLTYSVTDGDTEIGTMTVHTVRAERTGNISTLTIELKDAEGATLMSSVSELNFVTPVKTQKAVNFGDLNYSLSAEYSGRNFNYTLNNKGAETSGRIRAGNLVMDNQLLYTYLRGWDLEGGEARSASVVDPFAKTAEQLTARLSSGNVNFNLPFDGSTAAVACVIIRISRTEAPIGVPIYVTYTKKDAFSVFRSFRIPVRIVEENLTYTLIGLEIND